MALNGPAHADIVRAEDYQSFWLWAGVEPQAALFKAKELYLLAGEVSGRGNPHITSQRSSIPHVVGPEVWIVYRAQTLDWNDAIINDVLNHVQSWSAAGNRIAGLQIDFDSGTKHLDRYVAFLKNLRQKLPNPYRLSVTGLLDWSANAERANLVALGTVVDNVILQTYQGRHVIPNVELFLARLQNMRVPFRIGLLQGSQWHAPKDLEANPYFRGYVVFLVN